MNKNLLPEIMSRLKTTMCLLGILVLGQSITAQCPVGSQYQSYCYGFPEVDVVAFEVCPPAGGLIQSNILQANLPNNAPDFQYTLTVYEGSSGSGATGTPIYGPVGGSLAGVNITSLNTGQCLIFVINTSNIFEESISCQSNVPNAVELQVCSEVQGAAPDPFFNSPGEFCLTGGTQTGLSGGFPEGGVYSGVGVMDSGNGINFDFDPTVSGAGTHVISYTINTIEATTTVEVTSPVSPTLALSSSSLCLDEGVTLYGGGLPAGGEYSGPGVSDNGDGTNFTFNPFIAGVGIHEIVYSIDGACTETATANLEVTEACLCPNPQASNAFCYGNNEVSFEVLEICPSDPEMTAEAEIVEGTYGNNATLRIYRQLPGDLNSRTLLVDTSASILAGIFVKSILPGECLIFESSTGPGGSCLDGFQIPIRICSVDGFVSTSFAALGTYCPNIGLIENLDGGFPSGGIYSGTGVIDNGDGTTFNFDASVSGTGTFQVTYTVNGDPATSEIQILEDTENPVIVECPDNKVLDALVDNCFAILPDYTAEVVATDNCGAVTVTQSPSPGAMIPVGSPITVTFTATDENQLTSECSIQVEAFDTTSPTISCPGTQTLEITADCSASLPDYTNLATSDDNCAVQSVTQAPQAGTTVMEVGSMTVTLTVTDGSGLTSSCTFTVDKVDNTPPTITCPVTQTLMLHENCSASLPDYTSLALTDDNCGTQSVTQTPVAGTTVMDVGLMSVTLMVTDESGLTSTCSFTVDKVDNIPPTITCPGIQTILLEANCSTLLPDYTGLAVADDNCEVLSITQSPEVGTSIMNVGPMTVTLTVTDASGLTSTCSFTVDKIDNTPPTISCPGTQELIVDANCSAVLPDYTDLAITDDNCGVQGVTQSPSAGTTVMDAGPMTVTLTVTDESGLTSTCSFTVEKVDNTPPTIICPGTQTLSLQANCDAVLPDYTGMAAADDNCMVQEITQSPEAGTPVMDVGQMTVTLTVTDASGLTSTCSFTVEKVDNIPPTIGCPGIVSIVLDSNCEAIVPDYTGLVTTGDNCIGTTVTQIPIPGTLLTAPGQIPNITFTVTDDAGYSASCSSVYDIQQGLDLPSPLMADEIGNSSGSAIYLPCEADGIFEISANGFSSLTSDAQHFVHQPLCGNGQITARILSIDNRGFAGVQMRENLNSGSKKVLLKSQLSSFIRREVRAVENGSAQAQQIFRPQHTWLRLVRSGNNFQGYSSTTGTSWQLAFATTIPMGTCIEIGLIAESINNSILNTIRMDNVEIIGSSGNISNGVVSLERTDYSDSSFNLFPNPSDGSFILEGPELEEAANVEWIITDQLGRIIKKDKMPYRSRQTFNLTAPAGTYTLSMIFDNKLPINKILVIY